MRILFLIAIIVKKPLVVRRDELVLAVLVEQVLDEVVEDGLGVLQAMRLVDHDRVEELRRDVRGPLDVVVVVGVVEVELFLLAGADLVLKVAPVVLGHPRGLLEEVVVADEHVVGHQDDADLALVRDLLLQILEILTIILGSFYLGAIMNIKVE